MGIFDKLFGTKKSGNTPSKKKPYSSKTAYRDSDGSIKLEMNVPSGKLYILKLEHDPFTKEKLVKFTHTASYGMDKFITWADGSDFIQMCFGLVKVNEKMFLALATYQKTLKFKKGDSLSILFENDNIESFEIPKNGYRVDQDEEGVIIESRLEVSEEFVETLTEKSILKWRYTASDERPHITGTFSPELKRDMKEMANSFLYACNAQINE